MPRKKKQAEQPAGESVIETLKEHPALQTAAELSYPSFAEKIANQKRERPTGPRKRDGEPAASFASEEIRISKDGHMWQVEARRELTGNEKDKLAASGFHAVDDEEKIWNASQRELASRGTDINIVGLALGKPQVASGHER